MNLILKHARAFIPTLAALALIAAPAFAFAHDDSSGEVSGTVASQTAIAFPLQGTGVFIGAGGNALVRGATVQSVSGSTVTAKSSWGSSAINWVVDVASSTKFYDSRVAASSLADIRVGDTISFAGPINQALAAFTVNASAIRDWSATSSTATSTPTHPFPHPFFPVRIWNSLKADIGLHLGFGKSGNDHDSK